MRKLALAFGLLGLGAALAVPAAAQTTTLRPPSSMQVTTPYPRVSVQPGSTVKMDLTVAAPTTQTVGLEVTGLPAGWTSTLRGGGFVVQGVTADPDRPATAQLEVKVPVEAKAGTYPFTVRGTGPGGPSDLGIQVTISEQVEQAVALTTDFDTLRGKPGDTFTYTLTVANNTSEKQVFAFDPKGPEGWSVTASPTAETRASTATIDAGGTGTVTVTAVSQSTAKAGTFPLSVGVKAANGATAEIKLTAVLSGQTAMTLTSERLNLNARAGGTAHKTMSVTNTGSAPLSGVTFSAGAVPTDWEVTFEPDKLDIPAGEQGDIVANIRPSKNAVAGDYALTITASAGTASSEAGLRITVKTTRWWGLIGILIVVAALGVLYGVFRKFGRR
jgi:uncharacterized membrane protein